MNRLFEEIERAVANGQAERVAELLSNQENARAFRRREAKSLKTTLIRAAAAGDAACVAALLPFSDAKAADIEGETALHKAAQKGRLDIARLLLPFSDPNFTINDAFTPLMWAAGRNDAEMIHLLLPASNPNAQIDHGDSAITNAIDLRAMAAIALLAPVSDTALRGPRQERTFDRALQSGDWAVVDALAPMATLSDLKKALAQCAAQPEKALPRLWALAEALGLGSQMSAERQAQAWPASTRAVDALAAWGAGGKSGAANARAASAQGAAATTEGAASGWRKARSL